MSLTRLLPIGATLALLAGTALAPSVRAASPMTPPAGPMIQSGSTGGHGSTPPLYARTGAAVRAGLQAHG